MFSAGLLETKIKSINKSRVMKALGNWQYLDITMNMLIVVVCGFYGIL